MGRTVVSAVDRFSLTPGAAFFGAVRYANLLTGPHTTRRAEEGRTMDRCNELCTKETTGQCALCDALAERDRFIRLWMKGGVLREGLHALRSSVSRVSEQHKALVRRYIAAIWHQGHPEALEDVIAPTYVHHTSHTVGDGGHAVHGPDGVRRAVTAWRSAFPDLRFTLEDLRVDGDTVAARWTCHGTHAGVFRGLAPTGQRVTFTGITICRIRQGKIVEQWTVEDGVSLYQQLGLLRAEEIGET